MAANDRLSHTGVVTFSERLQSSGASYLTGAENIGQLFVHAFDQSRPFSTVNAAACQFRQAGVPVAVHTYATLSTEMMALWMGSEGHRANILNPNVTRVVSAAAISISRRVCGDVYLTQVFLDDGPGAT